MTLLNYKNRILNFMTYFPSLPAIRNYAKDWFGN